MLRNFFTIMMTFVLTMNITMASPHSGIKDAVDEFTYSMTVDGAALNQEQTDKAIEVFTGKLLALEASGMGREEIIDATLASITSKKTAVELKEALEHVKVSQMSSEEARRFLLNATEMSYQKGASWNADQALAVMFGLTMMVGFMYGLFLIVLNSDDCPTNYNEIQCQQWKD